MRRRGRTGDDYDQYGEPSHRGDGTDLPQSTQLSPGFRVAKQSCSRVSASIRAVSGCGVVVHNVR